jgi:predicted nucleic acid-binding protein
VSLVLADTSVWVAHFRRANPVLQRQLTFDQVLCHPLIVLEIACGSPPTPRARTLGDLRGLQQPVVATIDETLTLIEDERLHDSGCGAIDMALLASVLLTVNAQLWTADRKLHTLAARLGVAYTAASR